ncbi:MULTISPECIES: GNAT family N-acetyltransferase [Bacillus]|uniref:GNAT family N-acetyltransferase n=1 Tax=Bacillus TaxID=1386 RepID=UPI002242F891|nr:MULTISPECIES: GNAT family N-acetyltransferase [Bacillus]MDN5390053.1 GNAT family N-acetyltransferase [Bacillus sp. LB7]MEC1021462.1 GNAT family N-acetyltransferase [Bacillus paralicheniformis]MEC1024547.1 GNAT family N-acetyltransferase [Bacillus paralicheniformis]MEC1034666.1 GNAT family N-acetyltransferase [Bacillus paralicheniformis]MEC1049311.1 GNAT family N-acetyltransferase [Bacillus paralicheniformis]
MNEIEIRRPQIDDVEELNQFFRIVVEDTFAKEGISDLLDDQESEIESKRQYLKADLDSKGKSRHFFIASDQRLNKIIGTIEYGPASELIDICTDGALKDLYEVGTVFVHPDYQRHGIGTLLLSAMFLTFLNRGVKEFCLDSGYPGAQKIWKKKFGDPDYVLKDYWGKGYDHMIWRRRTKDMPIDARTAAMPSVLPKEES